ncbi:pseudouridine synthase [Rhodoferax sp. AJA081-3]|uniref:pseudouridine synthase n=1 Tax=Rhodoferax sp. AJA081-3 TaxID=2752316 RepID=UPI001ADFC5E6|nr:pseudouridine synthase [Rhodoferax sp. AJA081-3]QTN29368.1 pseudouridine synthase [Rhodoferax sp. AJA081-3]
MALHRPNAPPSRNGVGASCVVLPAGPWLTMHEGLVARFPGVPAALWLQRLQEGDVVDDHGQTIKPDTRYEAGRRLYYFRALAAEPRIPFEATILWQDEHLLVVDKPHFLPVVPSGKYLQETVLTRLKNALGIDALSPIHRIDRDTAGLVLFSKQVASRGAYQELFRTRQVDKTYECVAPWNPALPWPLRRESRIVPATHFMQQTEVDGAPNALTHITPIEVLGGLARYALKPVTGQRHQLRVHMAALGLPIVWDGIYPTLTPEGSADYGQPLQLLAQTIAFTDPITGARRQFSSQRQLRPLALLLA